MCNIAPFLAVLGPFVALLSSIPTAMREIIYKIFRSCMCSPARFSYTLQLCAKACLAKSCCRKHSCDRC